ncbi:MAG TPA: FAD-binding oxidoreductase [Anseongella sp.]
MEELEEHIVKILSVEPVTHNVKRFRVEKPSGYTFIPGQATEVAIDDPRWREEKRPFTFTSLNEWPDLEFTIKIYDDHEGVTNELGNLQAGDRLVLHDVWGAIAYNGPGTFLAGGAGITPFIAIFRDLHKQSALNGCSLYFSNRTDQDIILKEELEGYLGDDFHKIITGDEATSYEKAFLDAQYIRDHIRNFDQHFYICGPDEFVQDLSKILEECGASSDAVVFEK